MLTTMRGGRGDSTSVECWISIPTAPEDRDNSPKVTFWDPAHNLCKHSLHKSLAGGSLRTSIQTEIGA